MSERLLYFFIYSMKLLAYQKRDYKLHLRAQLEFPTAEVNNIYDGTSKKNSITVVIMP